jgi:DNA-binding LacI/PurR family transcriptional regulator
MGKGAMRSSIHDVARASGVSIGTVSRVFNNKPHVSVETREQVLEAAKRVRYQPRRQPEHINIGLVIHDLELAGEVGFVSDILAALARRTATLGVVLEIFPLNDIECVFRNYIQGLIAIIFGKNEHLLRKVPSIPIVSINNDLSGQNIHLVASDHAQGAMIATRHLVEQGHRKIGFMEIAADGWGSIERQRGYAEALRAAGIEPRPHLVRFTGHDDVRKSLVALLAAKPTALLVCGEDLSLQVSQLLLHELKVRIPQDLSLVTYETPMVSAVLTPPQTTVAQPWTDLGTAAVDTVLALIDRKQARPTKTLIANRLITRASVRKLA